MIQRGGEYIAAVVADEDDGKGHPRLILQLSCVSTWLYVTELEDARDSIELLNFDDNPGFFHTETLPISDSDETSGQCKRPVCVKCFLLTSQICQTRALLEV